MSIFGFLTRRAQRDLELDDELRAHLEMAVRDRMARGESRGDAEAAARREFGNVGHVKEVTREMWGGVWLERLRQDLRFAARSLRRSPTFTIVAALTLALGIGVNTAMFAVVHGVLLRPLPFADADRLFVPSYEMGVFGATPGMFDDHYVQLAKDTTIFEGLASYGTRPLTVTGVGDPLRLSAARVTDQFFSLLGARPQVGRLFEESDAAGDDGPSIILSDALWHSRFDANPAVVGTTIVLEGVSRTVVGVMPPSFDFPAGTDVWQPWRIVSDPKTNISFISVIGRLKAGLTDQQAAQMFAAYTSHLPVSEGPPRPGLVAALLPLKTVLVGNVRTPLLIFSGAIGFVLLIACANVANLLLMRVAARDREMAVRAALGAGRWRLVRQLLTETLALTTLGSIAGVAVALATLRLLLVLAPEKMLPRAEGIRIDPWTLAFTAALAIVTAIVCGAIPALHASEHRLHASLAAGARTVTGGRQRLRSLLVGGEIALALVLLTGAGLLVRSFERMRAVDLGFDPRNTLTVNVALPAARYTSAADMRDFHARVLANLNAIPGVESAGAINWAPFGNGGVSGNLFNENGDELPGHGVGALSVSPGYFRAIGIHIERGRVFTDEDRTSGARVAILSHSAAEKFWPGGNPIGKRIASSKQPDPSDWMTVVGVVNDVVQGKVAATPHPAPANYVPLAQTNVPFFLSRVTFVVRRHEAASPSPIAVAMTHILREADPSLALEPVVSISDVMGRKTAEPRFQSRMLLTFSLAALLLAMIGVYGVLSYNLSQRQQEIGVRIALGATPGEIVWMVMRGTTTLVVPGIVVGLGASFALTRVLGRFLFQITATDPTTFAFVVVVLGVVALAAAAIPARRASRVDPSVLTRTPG
ncbi:MAG TPA: ABC transporter permease [Gemmatimonadaceae bacterium]|jgi:predicted permease